MDRLKTSTESNKLNETIGEKLSQFRKKINEIVDYINEKEYRDIVENVVDELLEINNLNDNDIIEE